MQPITHLELYQGESWEEVLKPVYQHEFSISGTTSCTLTVKEDKTTKVSKTITDTTTDNLFYKPLLTPAETAALDAGDYDMTITINDTNFSYQFRYKLKVKE